jgi:two-component system sensor histidine kinase KdpD
VRETLPDSVLEQADEVELVDIAPEELLERFREGKVYRTEQAEHAAKHFFTKGNLLALRELALRTTAQRVDAQMDEARKEAGIRSTWDATERVLVCVGPSPMSQRLVRSARRLASSLKADWIAAYIETPGTARLSVQDRQRLENTLRLADDLGASTVTLSGTNIADELIAYAQNHNVTKIVVGKPIRSRWRDTLFGSVVDDLVRRSGMIDIYVIRGEPDDAEPRSAAVGRAAPRRATGLIAATLITIAMTAIGWPLYHVLGLENENVLMLYLLCVLVIAMRYSRSAAILASILSVMAFDLCFVHPYYEFAVSDRQYIVTFSVMLLTALVISTLTHRVRAQAELARRREGRTAALFALSKELAIARTTEQIAAATTRHVNDMLGRRCVVLLLNDDGRLTIKADSVTDGPALDSKELGVAQWACEHEQIAGRGTTTLPAAEGTYVPLRASRGAIGVLGLMSPGEIWSAEQRQLTDALASQAALSFERASLAEEARAAWERVEAEFLRNTLLSGVSHELRTPLAGITGAATALVETGDGLSPEARGELLETVIGEAERMDRLVNNLLDMTRLEAGGLRLNREWQPIQDVIGSALHALERRLHGREIKTYLQPNLPMVYIDALAIEQVLANLLDNAIEYTPAGSAIEIMARASGQDVTIEVADHGPGLPVGTEKRVFDKFFRAAKPESRRGIGLGLAICRGIVESHGGTISAANRPEGGAVFAFTLPPGAGAPELRGIE